MWSLFICKHRDSNSAFGQYLLLMLTMYFFTTFTAIKETAFLLAVSSAALTHALAKACSSGRMERCTCDDSPGIQHREAWQWGICGDNLKYSTKFLKKFLGQKRVSKDMRAQVDIHNINVGIKVSYSEKLKKKSGCNVFSFNQRASCRCQVS